MAITATDIYVRSGNAGSFTEIDFVKGGWITVASASNMIALDPSRVGEGQVVYIQHTNELYIGSFFEAFVTPGYGGFSNSQSFASFSWPGSGGGGNVGTLNSFSASINTFTASIQTEVDNLTALTASYSTTSSVNTISSSIAVDIAALETFSSSLNATFATDAEVDLAVLSLNANTGSYATTGSNVFDGNQSIDGLLILTTQSSAPTFISGGLYLDADYNLHIGSI